MRHDSASRLQLAIKQSNLLITFFHFRFCSQRQSGRLEIMLMGGIQRTSWHLHAFNDAILHQNWVLWNLRSWWWVTLQNILITSLKILFRRLQWSLEIQWSRPSRTHTCRHRFRPSFINLRKISQIRKIPHTSLYNSSLRFIETSKFMRIDLLILSQRHRVRRKSKQIELGSNSSPQLTPTPHILYTQMPSNDNKDFTTNTTHKVHRFIAYISIDRCFDDKEND